MYHALLPPDVHINLKNYNLLLLSFLPVSTASQQILSFHSCSWLFSQENQGQGTTDGIFRNNRYFTCAPDSGVFVGLDKLTPRGDSESKSPPKNNITRLKDTVITSFFKGKTEQRSSQGGKNIEKDQAVVTFLHNDHPVKGCVRYIGDHKDNSGNIQTLVGLELVGYLFLVFIQQFC